MLRARGHRIAGIFTNDARVIESATGEGLPTHPPKQMPAWLSGRPFDYLFSIANLARVPEDVLALPKIAAINFHDGPLPRYAGLNTPVHALLEGADRYGITWHLMEKELDKGAVLKQVRFPIEPGETALSLNTRCFEAALESFGELLEDLERRGPRPQAQEPGEFRYYGRYRRPEAACLLAWSRDAVALDAMIRALDYGRYANPMGAPKILKDRHALVVRSARVSAESGEPGKVLACSDRAVQVAAGTGSLLLTAFARLDGSPLSPAEAAAMLDLRAGTRLDTPLPTEWVKLRGLDETLARNESFWLKRLAAFDPLDAPFGQGDLNKVITIPTSTGDAEDFRIIAAFTVFLARLGHRYSFHIGYHDEALAEATSGLEALLAPQAPMRCRIDPESSAATVIERTVRELAKLQKHGAWLRDLVGRYPSSQAQPLAAEDRPFAVVVSPAPDFRPGGHNRLAMVLKPQPRLVFRGADQAEADRFASGFQTFLAAFRQNPERPIAEVEILDVETKSQVLRNWNDTALDYPGEETVHGAFLKTATRRPGDTAVCFEDRSLAYAELRLRAEALAAKLLELGASPHVPVGIYLDRSELLQVAMLGINMTGAAWLPLDPEYPRERIRFMLQDARVAIVVTTTGRSVGVPEGPEHLVQLDVLEPPDASPNLPRVDSAQPAYTIYTSGSTGKPKGVVVTHRNAINFFAAMDPLVPHDPPGVWLSVTSMSFDIAVLELLWTIARGFKVVILGAGGGHTAKAPIDFSLFYFSSNAEADESDKYRLLLDGARFADAHDFNAVWTPERHFNAFGGLFPDPSVTGAAVAAVTRNVQIRAGSVVLPLHHPARVAEAWSVVDNISNGRVALAFASGWTPADFVLRPQNYSRAKDVMFESLEQVRKLWRGEAVSFPGATGEDISVATLPRPVQSELPVWITTAGNPETWRRAGSAGANVLTHLLGQTIDDLIPKIQAYRAARAEAGHDPETGVVTLMLHSFVGPDEDEVRRLVRDPLKQYLGSSLNLLKQYAWVFPAFKRPGDVSGDAGDDFARLSEAERDAILEGAFDRYFETSGLFGRPETALATVEKLRGAGIGEIACLIDFGVPTKTVLEYLPYLDEVRRLANEGAGVKVETTAPMPELVDRFKPTHLQCTPSMARMFLTGRETAAALAAIDHLLIGGEAFPPVLAEELRAAGIPFIRNMYGPTETTIWSTSLRVSATGKSIPIGTPIGNNTTYILDERGNPVLPGTSGELYIGGHGVTRGYLRRPGLTATRFVPDHLGGEPGVRLYRTGDLARHDQEGTLHFIGRADHQVKLRGYRIELGEIEARLAQREDIAEAVVLVREDQPGDHRLTAYLIPKGEAPDEEEIRAGLGETLPDFMVPGHFVVMERFPLTPNRKLDRAALPAPGRQANGKTYAPPENETEGRIAELWADLLGVPKVGIDDNFFQVGGHSLLVVRLHRGLEQLLGKPIVLTELYKHTTVRKQAAGLGKTDDAHLQKSVQRAKRRLAARK